MYNKINEVSINDNEILLYANSKIKTMEGNLTLYSENGKLKLQNGSQEILYNIKSQLEENTGKYE